ncbi:hypothetical protein RJ639_044586 [Escallonia herrerae]|uniref:Carboxypeptidase n=1 Tax=Escallonia herrerae TaxID=1293975 RepID=A0AA88WH21_9ASTE|nr:hypothetical protein RJ639_044586 [Escallonia herrerae]
MGQAVTSSKQKAFKEIPMSPYKLIDLAMGSSSLLCFSFFFLLASSHGCYGGKLGSFNQLSELTRGELYKNRNSDAAFPLDTSPVYVGPQNGLKDGDEIESLPGQPDGVDFKQYSGYVTVDPEAGRALFYYFVESPRNSSTKPLVLWLNGGPGCSSLGGGAMMELGPFRVNRDGKTLYRNDYSWNRDANIIFLESPAGVGFSYSNITSDYNRSGDNRTAQDSYTFLVNWLERFPEYKTRDFYLTGESYAGHYVPQLAQTILHHNKYTNQTIINLKGIAIGNALIDRLTNIKGSLDYYWTHALISDESYAGVKLTCNFTSPDGLSQVCLGFLDQINNATADIFPYDIYAPLCNSSSHSPTISAFDPCSRAYLTSYLNIPEVQKSLHANLTGLPYPWENDMIHGLWTDRPDTVLPTIQELMRIGMSVWIYSGDTDRAIPVTATRYAITKLGTPVKTEWYPWYIQGEVGGYAVGYQNLTFVTVRGAGHYVPSYQPARALSLFSSFINGELPSAS